MRKFDHSKEEKIHINNLCKDLAQLNKCIEHTKIFKLLIYENNMEIGKSYEWIVNLYADEEIEDTKRVESQNMFRYIVNELMLELRHNEKSYPEILCSNPWHKNT